MKAFCTLLQTIIYREENQLLINVELKTKHSSTKLHLANLQQKIIQCNYQKIRQQDRTIPNKQFGFNKYLCGNN